MTIQTYLDFATPAIAAGAIKRKGHWSISGDKTEYGFVESLCVSNGIEPLQTEVPKGRSYKAIRKAARSYPPHPQPTSKDHYAMRARQYMLNRMGIETVHGTCAPQCSKLVQWDKAEDGSNRVRTVKLLDDEWHEVPHWGFIARVEDLSNITVDLGAELLETL